MSSEKTSSEGYRNYISSSKSSIVKPDMVAKVTQRRPQDLMGRFLRKFKVTGRRPQDLIRKFKVTG